MLVVKLTLELLKAELSNILASEPCRLSLIYVSNGVWKSTKRLQIKSLLLLFLTDLLFRVKLHVPYETKRSFWFVLPIRRMKTQKRFELCRVQQIIRKHGAMTLTSSRKNPLILHAALNYSHEYSPSSFDAFPFQNFHSEEKYEVAY